MAFHQQETALASRTNPSFLSILDVLRNHLQNASPPRLKSENLQNQRVQTDCDLRILNFTVVYDSSFCNGHGGQDGSEAEIRDLVEQASKEFESAICVRLNYNILEGYCGEASNDPFADALAKSNSADRLNVFNDLFDERFPELKRIKGVAFLFTGCNTEMDNHHYGIARTRVLCTQPRNGYGTVAFTGPTATSKMASLSILLHELGHSIGSGHIGAPEENIMSETFCNGCTEFSSEEITALKEGLTSPNGNQCLEEDSTQEDEGETENKLRAPSISPISIPTIRVSSSALPSSQPRNLRITTPSAFPSIIPFKIVPITSRGNFHFVHNDFVLYSGFGASLLIGALCFILRKKNRNYQGSVDDFVNDIPVFQASEKILESDETIDTDCMSEE